MPIVGEVLASRYQLDSILGVGGMASVFRATDLRLERPVAVKVLAATLAADPGFAERFDREARAMASFSHPNVAAVYDVEPGDPITGREPFYVMEYCDGGSLADRLATTGSIQPAELVPIVTAVADGLQELHRRGLIHRDVKPANILFGGDRPKLADFGIAREEGPAGSDALTLPGSTLGTAQFLAPELLDGAAPSAASDVYALGVTIFLSLTGRYPERAPAAASEGSATAADEATARRTIAAAAPDLGAASAAAVAAALDPDPGRRPSPADLAATLGASLGGRGVASPNPGAIEAGVDVLAPTLFGTSLPSVAAPPVATEPAPVVSDAPALEPSANLVGAPTAARPTGDAWRSLSAIAALILGLLVVVLLALFLMNLGGSPASSSPPTPSTAVPSAPLQLLAALDRVDAAIDAARGGKDGLTGRDANELTQLAASVRTAATNGDLAAARASAQTLEDRAHELTGSLDATRRDELLAAAAALLQDLAP